MGTLFVTFTAVKLRALAATRVALVIDSAEVWPTVAAISEHSTWQ